MGGKACGAHGAQQNLHEKANLVEIGKQRIGVRQTPIARDHESNFQPGDRAKRRSQELHELARTRSSCAFGNPAGDRSGGPLQIPAKVAPIAAGQSPARGVDFARERDALLPSLEIVMAAMRCHRVAL